MSSSSHKSALSSNGTQKTVCQHFLKGRCQFGDRCKFLHVISASASPAVVSAPRNPTSNYNTSSFVSLRRQIEPWVDSITKRFTGPLDMKKFCLVFDMISSSTQMDKDDKLDLFIIMTRTAGVVLRMTDIFSDESLDVKSYGMVLMKFLSSDALLTCARPRIINHLYGSLDAAVDVFLPRLVEHLKVPTNRALVSLVEPLLQDYQAILNCLFEYVQKYRQACADHHTLEGSIKGVCDAFEALSNKTPLKIHSTNVAYLINQCTHVSGLLRRAIGLVQQPVAEIETLPEISQSCTNDLIHLRAQWEAPGGRHANDHISINDIQIFPSEGEMLCRKSASIPANYPYAPHHIEDQPMHRQIDIMFRLLREDLMDQLRSIVQGVLEDTRSPKQPLAVAIKNGQGGRKEVGVGEDRAFCFLFTNAILAGVGINRRKTDYTLSVEFDRPRQLQGRLQNGSLVALINLSMTQTQRVFLGIVDMDAFLAKDARKAKVNVVAIDSVLYTRAAKQQRDKAIQEKWILIEFPGILVQAIAPFLEGLKNLDPHVMPFANYLQSPVLGQDLAQVHAPRFAKNPAFRFDLSAILGKPMKFNSNKAQSIEAACEAIIDSNVMDTSQARALTDCFTKEVVLIQGPPGTGKSYTGLQIVKTLLASGVKPLLLLCVTNHALDQFLEGIIDSKITEKIVRLGSKSQSTKVEPFTMHNLLEVMPKKSIGANRQAAELYRAREKLQDKIQILASACFAKDKGQPLTRLSSFIGQENIYHLEAFNNPPLAIITLLEEDSEWITVATKGKRVDSSQNDILQRWLDADDLAAFEEHQNAKAQEISTPPLLEDSSKLSRLEELAMEIDNERLVDDLEEAAESVMDTLISQFYQVTVSSRQRSVQDLLSDSEVWQMSKRERQMLYNFWDVNASNDYAEELTRCRQKFADLADGIREVHDAHKSTLLLKSDIIAATTNGAAQLLPLIRSAFPKALIVEEAGEVLEGQILACLVQSMQQLVLIGDHQQLRPHINSYALSVDSRKGKIIRADQSLFERLVEAKMPVTTLQVQRRMRPTISEFVRTTLYPNLKNHESTENFPKVKGVSNNVLFIDHSMSEDKASKEHSSRTNTAEAELVRAFALYMIRQGYGGRLAIITPYLGQVKLLKRLFSNDAVTVVLDERDEALLNATADENADERGAPAIRSTALEQMRITSIDNYQGEEADIIILSLVRNSTGQDDQQNQKGSIGFLRSPNRANVALSRARHGMFVFGNASLLEDRSPFWKQVLKVFRENNNIMNGIPIACDRHVEQRHTILHPEEFAVYAPDGGCLEPCRYKLGCGHTCSLKCHPEDHSSIRCPRPCTRLLHCSHPCPDSCGDPCSPCKVNIDEVSLPCGHSVHNITCDESQQPELIACRTLLVRRLPCGHDQAVPCGTPEDATVRCENVCGKPRECCNKPCSSGCHNCTTSSKNHVPHSCSKPLLCGHVCQGECGHNECSPCRLKCQGNCQHGCRHRCKEACVPCKDGCAWACDHQGKCVVPCGTPCVRLPCDEPCTQVLTCGHPCPSICGEPCGRQVCPTCAPESVRNQRVDVLMFHRMSDIDLSDPDERLITLSCGHAYTIQTLDGHFAIHEYYSQNHLTNNWTGVLAGPTNFVERPVCIDCRRLISVQDAPRYGRVIKRAQLDHAEKAMINSASQALKDSYEKLQAVDCATLKWQAPDDKLKSLPAIQKTIQFQEQAVAKQRDLLLRSSDLFDLQKHGFKSLTSKEWADFTLPLRKVYDVLVRLANQKSPQLDAYEAGVTAIHPALVKSHIEHPVRNFEQWQSQERRRILGTPPPLAKTAFAIDASLQSLQLLSTVIDTLKATNHEEITRWTFYTLFLLSAVSRSAFLTAQLSMTSNFLERAVEAWIGHLQAEIDRLELQSRIELARMKSPDQTKRQQLAEAYEDHLQPTFESCQDTLEEFIKRNGAAAVTSQNFQEKMDKLRSHGDKMVQVISTGVFYAPVSALEKQMIVRSFEFGATGHWFRCENGHSFCIGECGGAMQVSKCPECGAAVGGTSHALLSGVTRDSEMEAVAVATGSRVERYMWGNA